MKTPSTPLDRLFRAAARAPEPVLEPLSPGVVARILASRSASAGSEWLLLLGWLRRGFAVACALAVVILAFNLHRQGSRVEDDINAWNTIANLTWLP